MDYDESFRGDAALPPDVMPGDRYTAVDWLDILRQQFRPETWRAAIASEALRLNVTILRAEKET